MHTIFDGVDFSAARVSLVASMPGSQMGDDRGGWRRLQEAVAEQSGKRMAMEDPFFYVSSGHYPDGRCDAMSAQCTSMAFVFYNNKMIR